METKEKSAMELIEESHHKVENGKVIIPTKEELWDF